MLIEGTCASSSATNGSKTRNLAISSTNVAVHMSTAHSGPSPFSKRRGRGRPSLTSRPRASASRAARLGQPRAFARASVVVSIASSGDRSCGTALGGCGW